MGRFEVGEYLGIIFVYLWVLCASVQLSRLNGRYALTSTARLAGSNKSCCVSVVASQKLNASSHLTVPAQ